MGKEKEYGDCFGTAEYSDNSHICRACSQRVNCKAKAYSRGFRFKIERRARIASKMRKKKEGILNDNKA